MDVRMEDIPINLQAFVEIVGMENFLEITKLYGGDNIYIPLYKRIIIPSRNRAILREYNGSNMQELRKKYNLSMCQMKRLLEKGMK